MAEATKILIVDDEDNFRATMKDFLADYDYTVLTAGTGITALEMLEGEEIDLVISDLRLPKMDGIELTRKIIEMDRNIPVIVMTAYGSIESAVEAMKSGASDYITKPFKFEHILFIIERVMKTRELRELAGKSEYYKRLSTMDDLTGIHNYRFFKDMLQHEIERHTRYSRPISLLMVDIDNFKQINDTFGHLAGDQVLRQVARLLKKSIRSCDIVARYGGEEFAVILPETTGAEALKVGERIVKTVEKHRFELVKNKSLQNISVTVGLASFPKEAADVQQLISHADQALYQGKETGKNRVCVYSGIAD